MIRRFRIYLNGDGRVAAVVVLAYALALSFLVGISWVERLPKQYNPDFGNAKWIQLRGAPPAGYFRKSLYLPNNVDRGWLEIAATGAYDLYVNNILVDQASFPGVLASGIYDLKPFLSLGKNVIAVHVLPGQFPGQPKLIARGAYGVVGSPVQEFISDSSWKTSPTPAGIIGSHVWSSAELEDRLWPNAEVDAPPGRFPPLQQLTLDRKLLEEPQSANWIMPRQEAASYGGSEVSFHYDLHLDSRYTETWLQVAASGSYDLLVNGHLAGMAPAPSDALLIGKLTPIDTVGENLTGSSMPLVVTPWMPVAGNSSVGLSAVPAAAPPPTATLPGTLPASAASPAINTTTVAPNQPYQVPSLSRETGVSVPDLADITQAPAPVAPQFSPLLSSLGSQQATLALTAYDISNLVRAGINSIVVRVRSPVARGPALLLAEGLTTDIAGGPVRRFGTDTSWTTRTRDAAPAEHALVAAQASKTPWGPLPQVAANAQWLPQRDLRFGLRWFVTVVACTGLVMMLWLWSAPLFARDPALLEQLWTFDAFVQLPMLVVLLALITSTCDVRLAYDWCFRPAVAAAFLILLPVSKLALLAARSDNRSGLSSDDTSSSIPTQSLWLVLTLAGITLVGLLIRAWGLKDVSMSQDEVSMVNMSRGVLVNGLPHMIVGSYVEYPTSYEIVAYPTALSMLLFGQNLVAYRLPALLFGTCTIFLIGWVGCRMMNRRAGICAALIYAFLPTTINWSRNCFHNAQDSFFSLLTIWLFFEAIRGPELKRRYVTWSALCAILTYLSWEGSGFILPALFVAILVLRWGDFRWISDRHLWTCFLVVSAVVLIQLCYKALVQIPDYLGVVFDLSELSTPSLTFLDRTAFSPFFYLRALFFSENYYLLTLIVLAGLFFAWRERALLYLYLLVALFYVFYTGFLIHYSPRYCFFWTSPLVLAASGTFFHLWDRLAAIKAPKPGGTIRRMSLAAATALWLLGLNPYATKLYRLSAVPEAPTFFARLGVQFLPDFRSADRYLDENLKPGDAVIATAPHVFRFDTSRRPQYWLDAALSGRITYDGGLEKPSYIDKWVGVPVIRGLQDLKDVNAQYSRLFVEIGSPLAWNSPDLIAYQAMHGRVVHEGFGQNVILIPGATPDTIPAENKLKTAAP